MNRTRRVDRLTSCYENTRNFVSFELEDRFIVSYLFQRCIDIIKSVVRPLLPFSKFKMDYKYYKECECKYQEFRSRWFWKTNLYISFDTTVFFIIHSLGKSWKKRRFAGELFSVLIIYKKTPSFRFFLKRFSFLWIARWFHSFVIKQQNRTNNSSPRTIDLESTNDRMNFPLISNPWFKLIRININGY